MNAGQLVGGDLGLVAVEVADVDVGVIREGAHPQVGVARPAVGVGEIGGQGHAERRPAARGHRSSFQGAPSAVAQRSSTTIRSGSGPAYTQIISIAASDSLTK